MLKYRLKLSDYKESKSPALIMIHGYGSNMDDLFSFANYLPNTITIISLQAPYETPYGGRAWYSINFESNFKKWSNDDEAKISLKKIINQLVYFVDTYKLDPNDITLMGFSQGAVLSWSLLLDNPLLFRRAVCLSGYINQELLKRPILEYRNVLSYSSHGINDMTIPYDFARSGIEKLLKNNSNVSFNTFTDGHDVSLENFNEIQKWISKTKMN